MRREGHDFSSCGGLCGAAEDFSIDEETNRFFFEVGDGEGAVEHYLRVMVVVDHDVRGSANFRLFGLRVHIGGDSDGTNNAYLWVSGASRSSFVFDTAYVLGILGMLR